MSLIHRADAAGNTMELVDVGECTLSTFWKTPEEVKEIFENVPNFRCGKDDIMICSYPKTGTNWIFEVICMIVRRKAAIIKESKRATMLEAHKEEIIRNIQMSPKILNTHPNYRYLPKDLKSKKIKTILIVRNPKDVLVSSYNHHTGFDLYKYNARWEDWLLMYNAGKLDYGLYDQYLAEWEEQIKNGVGFPLHIVYYEDLKDFGVTEVKKLCSFLDVELQSDVIQDIVNLSDFSSMTEERRERFVRTGHSVNNFKFYRKGMVGDWKNWFTLAQNEMFDEIWDKNMCNSTFKFRYEPSSYSK